MLAKFRSLSVVRKYPPGASPSQDYVGSLVLAVLAELSSAK
jgi:hypothetical protein